MLKRAFSGASWAALALVLTIVWIKPGLVTLYGVDAACYGRVAREIAERPLADWGQVTWGGAPFYEHPPGFMWIESAVFRVFGSTPEAAVALARVFSSCVVLATWGAALLVAGEQAAAFSALAFLWLSGFQFDAQNPMLEMPLTAGVALAALGIAWLPRRGAAALFVGGFLLAAWVKGPPALAVFPLLIVGAWGRLRARHALALGGAALAAWALTAGIFEAWRAHSGLPSFFASYWEHQVLQSLAQGRNNPVASPVYYLKALWHWYPVGLIGAALGLGLRPWLRDAPGARRLLWWGLAWVAVFFVGFSLPRQKYHWYMHATSPGFAWVWGVLLSAGLARLPRVRAAMPWVMAAGVPVYLVLCALLPQKMLTPRRELEAMQRAQPPVFMAGERRAVANCGKTEGWHAMHMFDFLWRADAVDCDAAVPYRFDGERVTRVNSGG